ncbi:ribonuclease Y [Haliangium ochraceum]|uniref:Ribonuclease Y n=1 Tax=Haliangium ochraceum (strain DSM 14365 / JCM 11303 / SMP-2) TaxID=502025 RepID=D0LGK9_HALO1|nr:ribonuclease Y [Haliangium ochraceum]ACY12755.1 metal dependent phosphohydrolase [Haliangium ochraceum DSM 14365]
MQFLYVILAILGGITVGVGIARLAGIGRNAAAERAAEAEARRIITAAEAEVEEIKKAAEVEGKELAFRLKADVEEGTRKRRAELVQQEEALLAREREMERKQKDARRLEGELEKRERSIDGRAKAAEAMARKAEASQDKAKAMLEEIAALTAEQARERLEDQIREQAREAAAAEVKLIEENAAKEADSRAKEIVATAIQRYASELVQERTVSVIPLPSDDMKGRLIGREGRNIRALEAATGIDMIIDDTSEVITISCFNPVRREIARLAISKLVADGRIHPTRIEEVVKKAEAEIERTCKEAGEQAVFDLGLHRVSPELIVQLGRLKYRASYAQNLLMHSVEVGFLAGLMAAEVGLNVKQARRAGLLHDIGKSVDHELEGSHAQVGAQMARKFGESAKICQAIAAHHGDPEPSSVLDHIVDAANRLSSARPGARRELLASYVQRLEKLEHICNGFGGVTKSFALQAGREVRVMVENDKVDDAQALMLSKDIARKIETEATYPGQIRVVVVRETRASDYAR